MRILVWDELQRGRAPCRPRTLQFPKKNILSMAVPFFFSAEMAFPLEHGDVFLLLNGMQY